MGQHSFMQPQMMVHGRYFYDAVAGKYTVARYLDDFEKRYGGIDAALVWKVNVDGNQMTAPYKQGMRYFDLYHGVELKPEIKGDQAVLSFPTENQGYAAILATSGESDPKLTDLMEKMKAITAKPLSSYSHEWHALPQELVEIPTSPRAASAPEGMIRIVGGDYLFRVQGMEIEGSNDVGVDVQYPWEDSTRRFHEHPM